MKQHGADAGVIAAMRSDELLAAWDLAGARHHQAIIARINRLLAPPAGLLY